MRLLVTEHSLGKLAAFYIYKRIKAAEPNAAKPFVLGLPTGKTPLSMYKELIKLCQQKLLSFKHVVTFNMDEYVGLPEDHPQSFHHYMYHNFFNHVDIKPANIYILNGNATYLDYECTVFEKKISEFGGIDLLIGGIGSDGHIAFNEPGSSLNSVTRVKTLSYNTILANSAAFKHNIENTPKLVLTMGIKTILDAKEIVILAEGLEKSAAVRNAIEGSVSSHCPISALQLHNKVLITCDEFAAYELKLKTVRYFEQLKDEYDTMQHEFVTIGYT